MKNCKSTYKYSKITPQKKFHLLSLVLKEKMLIKDVNSRISRQQKLLGLTIQLQKRSFSSTETATNLISSNSKSTKTFNLPPKKQKPPSNT